jgi:hypothetical protein
LEIFQNKGYEVTVNANVLSTNSGVRLDVGANASYVTNKILQLPYNGNDKNRQGGLQVYDPKTGQVTWGWRFAGRAEHWEISMLLNRFPFCE